METKGNNDIKVGASSTLYYWMAA